MKRKLLLDHLKIYSFETNTRNRNKLGDKQTMHIKGGTDIDYTDEEGCPNDISKDTNAARALPLF